MRLNGTGAGSILGGGANTPHTDNHYGTAAANIALLILGTWYDTQYPGSRLFYNDQSLARGGLFDINGNWTDPHETHREGRNADIQMTNNTTGVPEEEWPAVEARLTLEFTSWAIRDGTHWHVFK